MANYLIVTAKQLKALSNRTVNITAREHFSLSVPTCNIVLWYHESVIN